MSAVRVEGRLALKKILKLTLPEKKSYIVTLICISLITRS